MKGPALALLLLLPAGPVLAQGSPGAQGTAPPQAVPAEQQAAQPMPTPPQTKPRTAVEAPPTPADLMFERSHWKEAPAGSTVSYRYARASGAEAVFGPRIDDRIRLTLEPGEASESRTVRVELFTGQRRRAAGPFESIPSNPTILIFLEHHLDAVAKALKANPRYLKNAIRAGLRERATVTPVTAAVEGRDVPAWQVEVRPFADDPQKERMRGLESLTYRFIVSEAVPGALLSAEARAVTPDGGNLLEEVLTYDPTAG